VGTYASLSAALAAVEKALLAIERDQEPLQEIGDRMMEGVIHRHGRYQPGWAKLEGDTVAHKSTGDSPRLETGAHSMASYQKVIAEDTVSVGTNDPIELFQEFGTFRNGKPAIPPRPIFSHEEKAAAVYGPEIAAQHVTKHLKRL
jgi:hypothetical protein